MRRKERPAGGDGSPARGNRAEGEKMEGGSGGGQEEEVSLLLYLARRVTEIRGGERLRGIEDKISEKVPSVSGRQSYH